jgi:H+/Cl- antiporter ClcA
MEKIKIVLVSLLIGVLNALFYIAVEFVDTKGTNFLWNDVFNTSQNRILVIPLAIFLSIIFSAVIIFFKQKRIGKSETNLLNDEEVKPTNFKDVIVVFIIGCTGLLAGASLGPEGVLVAISSGLGIWIAGRAGKMEAAKLLVLSSVGALLVGFFGSLFPILIPIIILYKKEKRVILEHWTPPIIAGIGTYVTLFIIKNGDVGFGTIPVGSTYNFQDLIGAFLLGIFGAIIAILIRKLIKKFQFITKNIDYKTHWVVSASIFGGILGILYLIGGPSIQFSGKEGTEMLLQNNSLSIGFLILIVITKLIATSWSLPAGYKGGLVFPTVFMAVALSMILTQIDPILGGPGITIGATAGMMTAMLPPIMGFILVLSMIPFNFILVAIAGLGGTIIGTKVFSKLVTSKNS